MVERISTDLIGRNIEYRVLSDPETPAFPEGNEVSYLDDYTRGLSRLYDFGTIIGDHREEILKDRREARQFTRESPLQNVEGEDILARILLSSAHRGEWQPFIMDVPKLNQEYIRTADECIKRIDEFSPNPNLSGLNRGILFGIYMAKQGQLVFPTTYGDKVIVIPSQRCVEFFASRSN